MAAITAGFWIGAGQTQGSWHRGLLVTAWILTGLLFLSGLVLIFLPVGKHKDVSERRPSTGIRISHDSEDTEIIRSSFQGLDTAVDNQGKRTRMEDVRITGGSAQPEQRFHRKVWSFPEMPWKRKKDTDSD